MLKEQAIERHVMSTVLFTLCGAVVCGAIVESPRIEFTAKPGAIEIRVDDQPLATYVTRDPRISRPYFKDLHAPGGVRVSRHHPPREGIDPADHPDYHPGLWLAFGDLSGADTWRNRAAVDTLEFVEAPSALGTRGTFTVRNRHRSGDRSICDEVCTLTFLIRPYGTLLLWDSVFQSDRGDFWFGDQEEMGLGVRVVTPIVVKRGQGGRILDDKGRRDQKGIWGKTANWCDYSGPVEGVFAGITIMPDPDNFRACWWHTRDYGFMTANPFGREAFKAGPASRVVVKKGEPFRLSYAVLLHAHPRESDLDLPAAYRDFLDVRRSEPGRAER